MARQTPLDPSYVAEAEEGQKLVASMRELTDAINSLSRDRAAIDSMATLAQYDEEYASTPAGTTVNPQARTSNLFLVEYVLWSLPATAAGTLTLGDRVIPNLSAGVNSLGVKILLQPGSVRQLVSTVSGAVYLGLSGRQLSPQMLLR
jgi:hypothetical protein